VKERTATVESRLRQLAPALVGLLAHYAEDDEIAEFSSAIGGFITPGSAKPAHLSERGTIVDLQTQEEPLPTVDGVFQGMRLVDSMVERIRLRITRLLSSAPERAERRAELSAFMTIVKSGAIEETAAKYKELEQLAQNGAGTFADIE